MNRTELHAFLTRELGLIPDDRGSQVSCTYFYQMVEWHPAANTRVFRVLFSADGEPSSIQLCASSDNNNTVLVNIGSDKHSLRQVYLQEVKMIEGRLSIGQPSS